MSASDIGSPSPRQVLVANEESESSSKVFAVLGLAVFLATLDSFIVNIAVPSIQRGFAGTSVAGLLVPAGKLGDILGRRRVFAFGLATFGLGSALCAAAPSLGFLIGARVLQGVGAAAVTPTSLGLLLPSIPAARRPGAIGAWAAIGAVGAASGPPLGGLLTTGLGWHWIFIVNVPLALIALFASFRVLPEIRDPAKPPLPDALGTIILIGAVALATLGVVQGPRWGWDARVIGCSTAAGACRRVYRPIGPPSGAGARALDCAGARVRARQSFRGLVLRGVQRGAALPSSVPHQRMALLGAARRPCAHPRADHGRHLRPSIRASRRALWPRRGRRD